MNLNSILMGSDDPQRLVDYYTTVFGEPQMSDGGYTGWQIGACWMHIGPHSEVHGKNSAPGRIILNIETPNVQQEFDRMAAAGAIVIREPYGFEGLPAEVLIATLADPDDNYFQLTSPMDLPQG